MIVAGLDEVGYGSLAGPLVAACVAFREKDLRKLPEGVTDSKKLSPAQRERLYRPIINACYYFGIGWTLPKEIDTFDIKYALPATFQRAVADLGFIPDLLIIDGTKRLPGYKGEQIHEPKADLNHVQVSAASIVAKVFRDRIMAKLGNLHPDAAKYGWEKNSGYGTAYHEKAIEKYGLVPGLHRRSYCSKFLMGKK